MPLERNFSSMQRKRQYRTEFWDVVEDSMLIVDGIDAHSIADMELFVGRSRDWQEK